MQYRGFSPALAGLKQELNSKHPELPRENSGSKWPKTSLGALKDNQRLTPEHLSVLLKLCRSFSKFLQTDGNGVLVDHLLIVFYKCRCAAPACNADFCVFVGAASVPCT
ncbi:TPA: hypothetical protein ACH3X3_012715 [Trebouxia sp. C0006]